MTCTARTWWGELEWQTSDVRAACHLQHDLKRVVAHRLGGCRALADGDGVVANLEQAFLRALVRRSARHPEGNHRHAGIPLQGRYLRLVGSPWPMSLLFRSAGWLLSATASATPVCPALPRSEVQRLLPCGTAPAAAPCRCRCYACHLTSDGQVLCTGDSDCRCWGVAEGGRFVSRSAAPESYFCPALGFRGLQYRVYPE